MYSNAVGITFGPWSLAVLFSAHVCLKQGSSRLYFLFSFFARNEAPYLKEWIEYHLMIGFDAFILMNDQSTDSTQCILDAYAEEGVVFRFEDDVNNVAVNGQGAVFDACVDHLASLDNSISGNTEQLWMATHDTDEFIWFNKTDTIISLKDAIVYKIQSRGIPTLSLQVPRLTYGASGKAWYESDPVIARFTHRYSNFPCPVAHPTR